jgi:two-component system phosphate regulon sensor histidine kinase PhoR
MKRRSLLWHLEPVFLLVAILPLVALDWYATRHVRDALRSAVRAELSLSSGMLVDRVVNEGRLPDPDELERRVAVWTRVTGHRMTVLYPDGRVAADTESDPTLMENHAGRQEVIEAIRSGYGTAIRYSTTLRQSLMYVAVPIMVDGRLLGVARSAVTLETVDAATRRLQRPLLAVGGLLALRAAVGGTVVARRLARPLHAVRENAHAMEAGALDRRIPESNIAEVHAMGEALNSMTHRLRDRIEIVTRQRDEEEALLACMQEGVLATDGQRRVRRMNPAAGRLFGVDPDRAEGRDVVETIRNADLLAIYESVATGGAPAEGMVTLAADGRELYVRGTALPAEGDRRGGVLLVLSDVTRLRRLETVRQDFVANVSHELKTPITAIRGFAETLREGGVDAERQARFVEIIARQAERMARIVEDLLLLSSIEHGGNSGMPLERAGLANVVEAAVQGCAATAAGSGVTVTRQGVAGLEAGISPRFLEQALINLLDNAIKYSPKGGTVEVLGEQRGAEVWLRVRDHGPGIESRHLPRLFERFYRVDQGRSRELGGTGLGLAIVKRIAVAHGGRVDVESVLGEGSTFSVVLPTSPARAAEAGSGGSGAA